jgi:hypothetical protein
MDCEVERDPRGSSVTAARGETAAKGERAAIALNFFFVGWRCAARLRKAAAVKGRAVPVQYVVSYAAYSNDAPAAGTVLCNCQAEPLDDEANISSHPNGR